MRLFVPSLYSDPFGAGGEQNSSSCLFDFSSLSKPPPLCVSLFVSTDSRLALNIHGGCQPLAHTKAGPGPRGLGQGGWRSRAHAERDSQVCAYVYVLAREKERETLSSPFISVSQWNQGAAVERKEGGSKGLVCALEHACTHTSVVHWGAG